MSAGVRAALRDPDVRAGIGLVVFGVAALAAGGEWSARSWVFPNLLSSALIVIGVVLVVAGAARGDASAPAPRGATVDALIFAAAVLGYFLLLSWLGYVPATVLFTWAVSVWLGERRDPVALGRKLIGCAAGVALLYGLFGVVLNVPLPSGAWS